MPLPVNTNQVFVPRRPNPSQVAASAALEVAEAAAAHPYEAETLDVAEASSADRGLLPAYSVRPEHGLAAPPKYSVFESSQKTFWHLKGLPYAAGLAAGSFVLGCAAPGMVALYNHNLHAAVALCTRIATNSPEMCDYLVRGVALSAAPCVDTCQKNPDYINSAVGEGVPASANHILRIVMPLVVLGLSVGPAAVALLGARHLTANALKRNHPDVIAARTNAQPIPLDNLSAV